MKIVTCSLMLNLQQIHIDLALGDLYLRPLGYRALCFLITGDDQFVKELISIYEKLPLFANIDLMDENRLYIMYNTLLKTTPKSIRTSSIIALHL